VKQALTTVAIALATAVFASVVILVGLTGDFEVAGLGALLPVYLLPSILGYAFFDYRAPHKKTRHVAYLLPLALLLVWLVVGAYLDAQKEYSDGSGDMALLAAAGLVVSGGVAYAMMIALTKR